MLSTIPRPFRTVRPRWFVLLAPLLAALGVVPNAAAGAATHGPAGAQVPLRAGSISHVLVVELENEGFTSTFGPDSPATYLNGTLRKHGVLLTQYYGTGHASLDNYIAQVSGQAPTLDTQADCSNQGFAFAPVTPGTPVSGGQ